MGFILPLVSVCFFLPANTYSEMWDTPKYFNNKEYFLCLATICFMILGAVFSVLLPSKNDNNTVVKIKAGFYKMQLYKCYKIATILCLSAYGIWIALMINNGLRFNDLTDMMMGDEGSNYVIRSYSEFIPGLTTLVQLDVCVAILYALLWNSIRSKWFHLSGWAVFLLTLFRSFFNSERLALVEAALPVILVLFRLHWRRIPRFWFYFFPVLVILTPYVLFVITERSRYWTNIASGHNTNYFEFCFYHLIGYYATALNNGAALWDFNMTFGGPTTVFNWFYNFPLLRPFIMGLMSSPADDYGLFLHNYLNEQFTNPSGIFPVFLDLGIYLGSFFWFGCGFISMSLYRGFVRGRLVGFLLFPTLVVGLVEIPRIFYWTSTRAFPIWCFLWIIIYFIWHSKGQAPAFNRQRRQGEKANKVNIEEKVKLSSENGHTEIT